MKRLILIGIAIILVSALAIGGCAAPTPTQAPAPIITVLPSPSPSPSPTVKPTTSPTATASPTAKPIVWRATTFLARNMNSVKSIYPITERAKQRSNGQLTINYLGGPEVIPAQQQAEAVRRGVIQMSIVPFSYYDGLVPLGTIMELTELSPSEERASGAYDYVNELHKKVGLYYLERGTAMKVPEYFYMVLKQPIEKPQQLAGKKIGGTSNNIAPFAAAIGAAGPLIPAPDVYSALERGVVDAFSYPLTNSMDAQLYQVVKYVVDHPYWAAGAALICNLDSFNELPPNLQTLLVDIAKEAVSEYMADYEIEIGKARQKATDNGMKFIKYAAQSDIDYWYKNLYEPGWAENAKRYPETVAKMRPLVTKKK